MTIKKENVVVKKDTKGSPKVKKDKNPIVKKSKEVKVKGLTVLAHAKRDFEAYQEDLLAYVKRRYIDDTIIREEIEKNKKKLLLQYVILKDKKAYGPIMEEWYKSPSKVLEGISQTYTSNIIGVYIEQVKLMSEIYERNISKGTVIEIENMYNTEGIRETDSEELKVLKVTSEMRMITYSVMKAILNKLKGRIKYKI